MPSHVIEAMRFEPSGRSLLIAYRGRGVYRYFDVSEDEWREFTSAPSKGTYLNREFKRRRHPYVKLDPRDSEMDRMRACEGEFSWPRKKA